MDGIFQEAPTEKEEALDVAKHDQDLFDSAVEDVTKASDTTQADNAETSNPASTADDPPRRQIPENLSPWSDSVDMATIADEMASLIKNYCVLTDDEVHAIVLWLLASYLINSFRVFPKLTLISPERRCGKTTTMEVILALSKDGLLASNMTAPTIYRMIQLHQITLMIDEADTFVKDGDSQLRGVINSSHNKKAAHVIRCDGDALMPTKFSTWAPIVLASIGDLDSTIMDRSIVVNLRRKTANEKVERLPEEIDEQCLDLRRKIRRWCSDNQAVIKSANQEPPDIGNDRAVDNWFPLYGVAHAINARWQAYCESAYKALTVVSEVELPTQLLLDIREILSKHKEERISSSQLLIALLQDDTKPWVTSNNGSKLTSASIANMLKPYGISPRAYRFPEGTKRGYEKGQFTDAFERYLSKPAD